MAYASRSWGYILLELCYDKLIDIDPAMVSQGVY